MSQADIDAFVWSANDMLTPEGVTTAVERGISVNGKNMHGFTALHSAYGRRELVVALLAAGADPNVKDDNDGTTSVWWAAFNSTADILQLLIDGGGSINRVDNDGQTPLIALVMYNYGDAAARLQVLLACPDLDLDAEFGGKTAQEWAVRKGRSQLALAIAEERSKRERWSALRASWITATATPSVCTYK
jgi:ankyrin repeat protein